MRSSIAQGASSRDSCAWRPPRQACTSTTDGTVGQHATLQRAPTEASVDSFDFMGDYCDGTGEVENRGVEYDWTRFWWDFHADLGYTVEEIFAIWDAADTHNWNINGDSPDADNPAERLHAAANAVGDTGMGYDYALLAVIEGVDQ